EDEIVVAADLVHVEHGRLVFGCEAAEHAFPQEILAHGKGRRREVDDCLCAGPGEFLDRIVVIAAAVPKVAIVPDVPGDADAESPMADLEDLRTAERLEVPILVEHVVGREQRFSESLSDLPVVQQRRGVEERTSFMRWIRLGQAYENRWAVSERPGERRE